MIDRARQIVQDEGPFRFSVKVLRALELNLFHSVYIRRYWYVFEHDLSNMSSKRLEDYLPTLPGVSLKIVRNLEEALQFQRQGFDILDKVRGARARLGHGALAFCVFSEKELAHVGWLCMTEEARNSVNPVPFAMDFAKMASLEGSETLARSNRSVGQTKSVSYRGLLAYTYFMRAQYLVDHGIFLARYAIVSHNLPSRRIAERFGARVIAKIRLVRLLGIRFWKEHPQASAD